MAQYRGVMGPWLTGDENALWAAAARVLDANWTGMATVPSPGLYPHHWSWDSAFVGVGLAHHRPERARTELLTLFRGQWESGMLPHIVFNSSVPRRAYFPGPDLWRSSAQPGAPRDVDTSGLTQPPLHAFAALRVARSADSVDKAFLGRLYPCLARQHAYFTRYRDLGGAGLAAVCHPWESGLDDSPVWDRPLAAAVPLRASSGAGNDRYVALVTAMRDAGYRAEYLRDEHPFAVEDPLYNAVLLASTDALAEIAQIVGADAGPHRAAAVRMRAAIVDRLWDEAAGCFRARDLRAGRLIPETSVSAFVPLLDPALPGTIVQRLADQLLSARFAGAAGYPVPTCDIQSESFDRSAYWRGPTWVNTNWLVWLGARAHGLTSIADLLFGSTLRLVRQSGFREYFDPFDGGGRGSHDFSWTAALLLDLLASRRVPGDRAGTVT